MIWNKEQVTKYIPPCCNKYSGMISINVCWIQYIHVSKGSFKSNIIGNLDKYIKLYIIHKVHKLHIHINTLINTPCYFWGFGDNYNGSFTCWNYRKQSTRWHSKDTITISNCIHTSYYNVKSTLKKLLKKKHR